MASGRLKSALELMKPERVICFTSSERDTAQAAGFDALFVRPSADEPYQIAGSLSISALRVAGPDHLDARDAAHVDRQADMLCAPNVLDQGQLIELGEIAGSTSSMILVVGARTSSVTAQLDGTSLVRVAGWALIEIAPGGSCELINSDS